MSPDGAADLRDHDVDRAMPILAQLGDVAFESRWNVGNNRTVLAEETRPRRSFVDDRLIDLAVV